MKTPHPTLEPAAQQALSRAWWSMLVRLLIAVAGIALLFFLHANRAPGQEIIWPWNTRAGSLVATMWLFCLGGAIGSFLNVVVYRWPAGKSIVHPPSTCPACGRAIRGRDNVPVLGWLWLGGRCRDCGSTIAVRYPTVELICGFMFVFVAHAQLGHLAPWSEMVWYDSLVRGPVPLFMARDREAYWALFLVNVTTWCTLLVAGLMRRDGHAVDRRVWIAGATGACLAQAWFQSVLVRFAATDRFFDATYLLIVALSILAPLVAHLGWQGEPVLSAWLLATVGLGWAGGALILLAAAASCCVTTGIAALRGVQPRPWLEHVVAWFGVFLLVKLPPGWYVQPQRNVWTAMLVVTCLVATGVCLTLAGWLRPSSANALGQAPGAGDR